MACNTQLEGNSKSQTMFAIIENTRGIDPNQLYYIENTDSDDLSYIIDAGITDGLSLLESSKALRVFNLTDDEIILKENTHVANVFACDEKFILSVNDKNRAHKMKLYDEYKEISDSLLQSIERCSDAQTTNVCAALGPTVHSEEFLIQRARIQALSPRQIQEELNRGTIQVHEVTAHVLPCIDLFCGIGGFSKGVHDQVQEGGKMIKVFLAIDNDSTRMRVLQRNNPGIPHETYKLGGDFTKTERMIKSFVHEGLLPFTYAHAHPPCAASTGIETLLNTRTVHWTIALFALLSPDLTWTIEHKPNACHEIVAAPNVHARTINFNEYTALGVQCKRTILSNRELRLPDRTKPMSLGEKLGHQFKSKHLLQFNSFNKGKTLDEEGFPLITGIPIKVGTNLKNAKQLSLNQTQCLTGMDTYDIRDLGKSNPKEALVESTPPAIARILACAAGDHIEHSLATCASGFRKEKPNPAEGQHITHDSVHNMNVAIHSFGVATNALQEEAIQKLQELRRKSKLSTPNAESSTPTDERTNEQTLGDEQHSSNDHQAHAMKITSEQGKLGEPTPQQRANAHRQSMLDMSEWSPDYSDCIPPSAADIQNLMDNPA